MACPLPICRWSGANAYLKKVLRPTYIVDKWKRSLPRRHTIIHQASSSKQVVISPQAIAIAHNKSYFYISHEHGHELIKAGDTEPVQAPTNQPGRRWILTIPCGRQRAQTVPLIPLKYLQKSPKWTINMMTRKAVKCHRLHTRPRNLHSSLITPNQM